MWPYPRLALILMAALAVGVAWYVATRPGPTPVGADGMKYDPIEDDPQAGPSVQQADREARDALKDVPRELGWCHGFWATKKRLLKDRYGIDWRTPAEMNPTVAFD